jgi:hypothetical protein
MIPRVGWSKARKWGRKYHKFNIHKEPKWTNRMEGTELHWLNGLMDKMR